ncbi:hypothetical protein GCM10009665_57260 [Kitasatospora nipponensis]|uniref:Uncharacterized protein n=1 Tax=Kitasatospora nipponensis TaxID=258049 RepID=A0ABN1WQU1_9ACTN
MSEATPNAKGPAKMQMSPEQLASLGLTATHEPTAPVADPMVPITVRALPVNRANLSNGRSFEESDTGVVLQWQLPEALAAGYDSPESGHAAFPLVPNRWLVVRSHGPVNARRAAGWVVHSDYLDHDGPHGAHGTAQSFALNDGLSSLAATEWSLDRRVGSWVEMSEPAEGVFLTSVGPGLPTFAAYQPYNETVFTVHDSLVYPNGDPALADRSVGYQVVGWYSDGDADIPKDAAGTPGLLLADLAEPADLLNAIGWRQSDASQTPRTLYSGTALGVAW